MRRTIAVAIVGQFLFLAGLASVVHADPVVHGRVTYENLDYQYDTNPGFIRSSVVGVPYVQISLRDKRQFPEQVWNGTTDANGNFTFYVDTVGFLQSRDLYLVVTLDNGCVAVKDGGLIDWGTFTWSGADTDGDGVAEQGKVAVNNLKTDLTFNVVLRKEQPINDAARIVDLITYAYHWVYDATSAKCEPVVIKYQSGVPGDPGWNIMFHYIGLYRDDVWNTRSGTKLNSKLTAWNEYAHHVMWCMYGQQLDPEGKPVRCAGINGGHDYNTEWDNGWGALVEGFPEFFEQALNNPSPASVAANLVEVDTWYLECAEKPGHEQDMDGNVVEGAIANILWDIIDSGYANDDAVSMGFHPIYDTLALWRPKDLLGFWDHWEGGERSRLIRVFQQNGIDVASDVQLANYAISKTTLKSGDTFSVTYWISSKYELDHIILGMSIRKSGTSTAVSDPAHDSQVVLAGGPMCYGLPRDFDTSGRTSGSGNYDVALGIWVDENYNGQIDATDYLLVDSGWKAKALYIAEQPVQVSVMTSPAGRSVFVDGTTHPSPFIFSCAGGSTHTIGVSSPQPGAAGVQYVYGSWSDAGGQTHTVTAPPSNTTYTATFATQYALTTSANPSNGGTVSPAGTTWHNSGAVVSIQATANPGWTFTGWTGDATGSQKPVNVTLSGPKAVTAGFSQQGTIQVTVASNPTGRSIMVDGTPRTTPYTLSCTPGSLHSLGVLSPQGGGATTRYAFAGWSDGGAQNHDVSPSSNATYTATFTTQYALTTSANPSNGGSVTPAGTTWHNSGAIVSIQETANPGWTFTGWTGDATGSQHPVSVTMSGPKAVTAGFSQQQGTIQVTVASNPTGRSIVVDGTPRTTPYTLSCTSGSLHSLGVLSPQGGGPTTRHVFTSWNDGGAQNHDVSPSSNATYTATFTTQYALTTSANPSNGGSVTPAGTTWHNSGAIVSIQETANPGWTFTGWTGDATGSQSPVNVMMDSGRSLVANFGQNSAGTWSIETVTSLAGGESTDARPSIAVEANGRAHITYSERSGDLYALLYALKDQGTWSFEGVHHPGWGSSLVLNSSGEPQVSYTCQMDESGYPAGEVMFARRDNSTGQWAYQEADKRVSCWLGVEDCWEPGSGTSLALDGSGYPHIVEYGFGGVLDVPAWSRHVYDDGSATWNIEDVGSGYGCISIGTDDMPRIATLVVGNYYRFYEIVYEWRDVSGWHYEMIQEYEGYDYSWELDAAADRFMALDSANTPHIVYVDHMQAGAQIKVAVRAPSGWVTSVVDSAPLAHGATIAMDAENHAHLCYWVYDEPYGTGTASLIYAHETEAGWTTVTVDSRPFPESDFSLGEPRIAVEPSAAACPHIVYQGASGTLKHAYVCGSSPPPPPGFSDNMEFGQQWAATGLWHLTEKKSLSPTHSQWYGDDATGTYESGVARSDEPSASERGANSPRATGTLRGELTSPALSVTGGTVASLSFQHWREVEYFAGGSFDKTYVQVKYGSGAWQTVWSLDSTTASSRTWQQVTQGLNVPAGVSTLQVRFVFDAVDNYRNRYPGWFIDDVAVSQGEADKVAAVTFTPAPSSYSGPVSVTLTSATPGATIRYTTDGTEPTERSSQYSGPISVAATTTIRARAFTGWAESDVTAGTYTIRAGGFADSMESGQKWTAAGLWHLTMNKNYSPIYSQWFGDESTGTYGSGSAPSLLMTWPERAANATRATGKVYGELTSPSISLTGGATATLSFWFWREVEYYTQGSFDKTYVQVKYGGGTWQTVWSLDSKTTSVRTWQQVTQSLSVPTGVSTLQVRFVFDSVDSYGNNYRGWYIDDVAVDVASSLGFGLNAANSIQPRVTVRPNPIQDIDTGTFHIEGMDVSAVRVEIYDLGGSLVFQGESAGAELLWHTDTIAGEYLANGVYIYKVWALVDGQWIACGKAGKVVILR